MKELKETISREIYRTALNTSHADWIRLQRQYKGLEAKTDELMDFVIRLSRAACLEQILDKTCICFSCKARKLMEKYG